MSNQHDYSRVPQLQTLEEGLRFVLVLKIHLLWLQQQARQIALWARWVVLDFLFLGENRLVAFGTQKDEGLGPALYKKTPARAARASLMGGSQNLYTSSYAVECETLYTRDHLVSLGIKLRAKFKLKGFTRILPARQGLVPRRPPWLGGRRGFSASWFLAWVSTTKKTYTRVKDTIPWRNCYLRWFGRDEELTLEEYRSRCITLVRMFNAPVFVTGRKIFAQFEYSPTMKHVVLVVLFCYPQNELVAHIQRLYPPATEALILEALRMLAPRYDFQTHQLNSNYGWNYGINKLTQGHVWRQLCPVDARPVPFPQPAPKSIIMFFCPPRLARMTVSARAGYWTKTLPLQYGYVAALARFSCPSASVLPCMLPDMVTMGEDKKLGWLDEKLNDEGKYSSGLATGFFADEAGALRSMQQLKKVLQDGAGGLDVALVFHHAAADPRVHLEDWTLLLGNLTPCLSFRAHVSVDKGWDTTVYRRDGLDYILTVRVHTLRLVHRALATSKGKTKPTLAGMLTKNPDDLRHWIGRTIEDEDEVSRLYELVLLSKEFRTQGPNAYKGNNPRVPGYAVPVCEHEPVVLVISVLERDGPKHRTMLFIRLVEGRFCPTESLEAGVAKRRERRERSPSSDLARRHGGAKNRAPVDVLERACVVLCETLTACMQWVKRRLEQSQGMREAGDVAALHATMPGPQFCRARSNGATESRSSGSQDERSQRRGNGGGLLWCWMVDGRAVLPLDGRAVIVLDGRAVGPNIFFLQCLMAERSVKIFSSLVNYCAVGWPSRLLDGRAIGPNFFSERSGFLHRSVGWPSVLELDGRALELNHHLEGGDRSPQTEQEAWRRWHFGIIDDGIVDLNRTGGELKSSDIVDGLRP
ncbi:hypothetical protein B0H16DRAFT_1682280 [Mycena metata]|uniref:Uncharacterized protein n=1 Tax=Mycena metata TaxID=1033252 RepID=A0AAD7P048_9AGAR|nr:hypothetical protein B0H16DRAFT_1682280 [Mycena metata]